MTIALGIRTNDGIVLCADMQKTISGYTKTFDGKVDTTIFHEPRIAFAIAGAGTDDHIMTARQALLGGIDEAIQVREEPLFSAIPLVLKERFLRFFDDHLARLVESERPSVELLVGVTGENLYPRIFYCSGTSFHETGLKAIGSGVLIANQMLTQYGHHDYNCEQAASLGVYIIRHVKETVDGCGGDTHLVALRKGCDFAISEHKQIKAMEDRFDAFEKKADQIVVQTVREDPLPLLWSSEYGKRKKEGKDEKQGNTQP